MRVRRGTALLEAVVAIAILATAGIALMTAVTDAARTVARAQAVDAELREASAFMDAVSLWPRADLDRHLGDREQGRWRLRIERASAALYVVSLRDSTGGRELLRTSLYRQAEDDASR
jgi:type II secretory pathway component PulJ